MASYSDMANKYLPLKTGESVPTDADYTNWMTEGLQQVINAVPPVHNGSTDVMTSNAIPPGAVTVTI